MFASGGCIRLRAQGYGATRSEIDRNPPTVGLLHNNWDKNKKNESGTITELILDNLTCLVIEIS